ncbi:hypothetical protein CBM2609_A10131 [Cupriavidus taiwanensis]|nr:hypothetical protein CBM2604_A10128 [Cupriavidus taiwanensis]SOZ20353.1 hypothetical protein CBM2609_A10131 [Cupriavidus taiwanensis]SOZ41145.1 hypothetical protein CBM2610_A10155 [Cupriavidus taiwanensis]
MVHLRTRAAAGIRPAIFGACMIISYRTTPPPASVRVYRSDCRVGSPVYVAVYAPPERANRKSLANPPFTPVAFRADASDLGSFFRFTFFFHVYR